ncbi:hypothetical protein [Methanosphaera sp.]|uniref:HK97 gp10 family phage protein n=1 Tax=Methanosphaera sp. TaxID=2666342 RepID=UPI0025F1FD3C|nr:hypothetical protein [Methanosphaera sp.]
MPGKYSHDIIVKADLKGFKDLKIPKTPIFKELTTTIRKQFRAGKKQLKNELELIIPTLATFSWLKQRVKLAEKGSIITGTLHDSIKINRKSKYRASIGTTLFYAQYVEEGRGPVTPKNKPYLTFKIPGVGWIRTKYVGPAKPRYYLKESSVLLENEIDDVMTIVMEAFSEGYG